MIIDNNANVIQELKARAQRINGIFKIGYNSYDNQNNLIHSVGIQERELNISTTGLAFHVGEIEKEWLEYNVEVFFQCNSGQVLSIKADFIRHVIGKPNWKAFSFVDTKTHQEQVEKIISSLQKTT
jgi:hypothetical protein